jgi:hypothetical protein
MPAPFSPLIRAAFTGFALALAATGWCAFATGPGLGLYFGSTLLAALYIPALALAEIPESRWITALSTAIAVALCWGVSPNWSDITVGELLRCTLIFTAFAFALAGAASALSRAGIVAPLAAGIIVMVAMLWLTWPVWLSHALNQTLVDWLVPAHPLLAINSVLRHLGAWDRAPLAYQKLTVLNQDIPYHLPRSIVPATLLHGVIGAIGFWFARPRRPIPASAPLASPEVG